MSLTRTNETFNKEIEEIRSQVAAASKPLHLRPTPRTSLLDVAGEYNIRVMRAAVYEGKSGKPYVRIDFTLLDDETVTVHTHYLRSGDSGDQELRGLACALRPDGMHLDDFLREVPGNAFGVVCVKRTTRTGMPFIVRTWSKL